MGHKLGHGVRLEEALRLHSEKEQHLFYGEQRTSYLRRKEGKIQRSRNKIR